MEDYHDGEWQYRIKNTGASSGRLGSCEVCGKHVPEMYIQTELRDFSYTWHGVVESGRALHNIKFGHEDCLISIRKGN